MHHFLPQSAETATVKTLLYGLSLEAPQVGSWGTAVCKLSQLAFLIFLALGVVICSFCHICSSWKLQVKMQTLRLSIYFENYE